jgi:hypothetical protein
MITLKHIEGALAAFADDNRDPQHSEATRQAVEALKRSQILPDLLQQICHRTTTRLDTSQRSFAAGFVIGIVALLDSQLEDLIAAKVNTANEA